MVESFIAAKIRAVQTDADALQKQNLETGQAVREARHERLAPFFGHDYQAAAQLSAVLHPERKMHPGLRIDSIV